jgi:hypothetical protein
MNVRDVAHVAFSSVGSVVLIDELVEKISISAG